MGDESRSLKNDKHPRHLDVLMELAKDGLFDEMKLSTTRLSGRIGMSQQSASRLLMQMEAEGLLRRKAVPGGKLVSITWKGRELLRRRYDDLGSIFSLKKISFTGELVTGLGQGGYFVGLKGYRKQFKDKLNFIPYAGTLNLKVDARTGSEVRGLSRFLMIDGFSTKKKTFGSLKCSKAKIEAKGKSVIGAVVMPFRTVHAEDIVEIISPRYLRDRLRLKDGDKVRIVV